MEADTEWFAARLREALSRAGVSQAELLRILKDNGFEMNQGRLSHYMQGRNYPDPPVLKELVRALGVSADWLLGLTEVELPVAELNEMIAEAKGEGPINKVLKRLPDAKQRQVMQYAEYVLAQHLHGPADDTASGTTLSALTESRRIAAEAQKWLESIERTRGVEARKEIEKIFRDKGIFLNRAS